MSLQQSSLEQTWQDVLSVLSESELSTNQELQPVAFDQSLPSSSGELGLATSIQDLPLLASFSPVSLGYCSSQLDLFNPLEYGQYGQPLDDVLLQDVSFTTEHMDDSSSTLQGKYILLSRVSG